MDIYLGRGMSLPEIAARLEAAIMAGVPARRTATRSHSTIPTHGVSRKTRLAFSTDSHLEAEAAMFADVLEDVVTFSMQPVALRYHDGNRAFSAFPDIGLKMLDGSVELWEVKPERVSEQLVRRLGTLARLLHAHGIRYRVRTPFWMGRSPRHANVRAIWAAGGITLPDTIHSDLQQCLSSARATTLGALRAELGVHHDALYAGALRGLVAVDLDAMPLCDGSPVRAPAAGALSGGYLGAEAREVRA
jgi:hypothetical protein